MGLVDFETMVRLLGEAEKRDAEAFKTYRIKMPPEPEAPPYLPPRASGNSNHPTSPKQRGGR